MRKVILLGLLAFTSMLQAGKFGEIEGFSIKNVPLYDAPKGKKLGKIAKENIATPIEIKDIGPKGKYYKISHEGKHVWVKKRNVISSNIQIDCLALSSDMNRHVAGSKALTSANCK